MKRGSAELLAALFALALVCLVTRAHAGDPALRWYTIETPHFRIHYHSGLESIAQRTADLAEGIHERLVPHLGYRPREITHIALTDDTDSANGSATALPYNQVRLFVSAPDDMSPLGDYDSWLLELLTHEYTHILHVDNMTGIPVLLNDLLGKTYSPNQAQPRWILEGLAVATESAKTSGGRLRSTQFDMYLRADVLAGNLARLDQISNPSRRWPSGNLWYLYGGKFIEWISDVYGPDTYAAVATDYGTNPIAWGINRSIRRVTGRTYEQLYEGWRAHLHEKYSRQMAQVLRRGLREGKRLTRHGRVVEYPRFAPPECAGSNQRALVYVRDDGHERPGVYRLELSSGEDEIVARSSGRVATFDAECGIVFDGVAPSRRRYYFSDLFRQPPGTRSPNGLLDAPLRLTTGLRAREPDVSRDGRRIVYVTNDKGTSTLRIATLTPEYEIRAERRLVPSAEFEQAYTPRFSPDGNWVAYSAWTAGGYRDIRIVDLKTGRFRQLMRDRALDQQPSWSRDGSLLYFVSDRTGIANVYAYELASGALWQVTNVRTGAYMPDEAPDGRSLVYVGYTSQGFDLYELAIDRQRWLLAEPAEVLRPAEPPSARARNWAVDTYNPLSTFRPAAYEIELGPTAFGDGVVLRAQAADMLNLHGLSLNLSVDFEFAEPQAALSYVYRRLPFDLQISAFHTAAPRRYRYGDELKDTVEHMDGATTGISYSTLGTFDYQNVGLSYTAYKFSSRQDLQSNVDPFSSVPIEPHRGFMGIVHLGYSYSNAEAYHYSVSAERGMSLVLGLDHGSETTASDHTLTSASGRITAYIPTPVRHHVLALSVGGGAAIGSYPRQGLFYSGGFLSQDLVDAFQSGVLQSAFVLRGYKPGQFAGRQYNLLNAEYRFPIWYADRGISTLPAFLRTLSGALFADYGGAFDRIDNNDPFAQYHLGLGGELWIDFVAGYFASGNVRLGYAKGTSDVAPGAQRYIVVASQF